MSNALISVSDKSGVVKFARELAKRGINILSTGGTAKTLGDDGVPVTEVSEHTGFPEMMGGRVKTLHPKIHGGILGVRSNPKHIEAMSKHGLSPIDIVVVNLYPFQETIAKEDVTWAEAIEQIDIGGPAMVRSAAKNHESVVVVVDPNDYQDVLAELIKNGQVGPKMRKRLAAKAFYHTARYDMAIARYMSDGAYDGFFGKQVSTCKYGENAWQTPAGLFSDETSDPLALPKFEVIEGTDPGYNNWTDIDRMLQTATHIAEVFARHGKDEMAIAVGVKHGNPCGAAVDESDRDGVLKKMMVGDPLAIFGGLVMVNFEIDEDLCQALVGKMLDGIVAPSFTEGAVKMLRRKGDKCRFIVNPALSKLSGCLDHAPRFRYVRGGALRQPNYTFIPDFNGGKISKLGKMTSAQKELDMMFAWAIGSTSNSNTITIVKNGQLLGNGTGQQDRVGAANLAKTRAIRSDHDTADSVGYSDSFFPFDDGPDALIKAGVTAIFTTSGSKRDQDTIDICKKNSVTLYMVPDPEGRGFCAH